MKAQGLDWGEKRVMRGVWMCLLLWAFVSVIKKTKKKQVGYSKMGE